MRNLHLFLLALLPLSSALRTWTEPIPGVITAPQASGSSVPTALVIDTRSVPRPTGAVASMTVTSGLTDLPSRGQPTARAQPNAGSRRVSRGGARAVLIVVGAAAGATVVGGLIG